MQGTTVVVSKGCVHFGFAHRIKRVTHLAALLKVRGQFAQGAQVTHPFSALPVGSKVRFTTDKLTRSNRHRPAVRSLFRGSAIVRSSVRISRGLGERNVRYVDLYFKSGAGRAWCQFTQHHKGIYTPEIFDRRIILQEVDEGMGSCIATQLIVPVKTDKYAKFSPKAVYSYLRFGPLPFSWRSVAESAG